MQALMRYVRITGLVYVSILTISMTAMAQSGGDQHATLPVVSLRGGEKPVKTNGEQLVIEIQKGVEVSFQWKYTDQRGLHYSVFATGDRTKGYDHKPAGGEVLFAESDLAAVYSLPERGLRLNYQRIFLLLFDKEKVTVELYAPKDVASQYIWADNAPSNGDVHWSKELVRLLSQDMKTAILKQDKEFSKMFGRGHSSILLPDLLLLKVVYLDGNALHTPGEYMFFICLPTDLIAVMPSRH